MMQEKASDSSQEQVAEVNLSGEQAVSPEAVEQNVGEGALAEEDVTSGDVHQKLQEELAAAQAKADEYLDRLQRSAAEFQNSRRRQEKQMAEQTNRANGDLLKRLLPVLDDLHLAFQNLPAELQDGLVEGTSNGAGEQPQQAWLNGFRQIQKKLLDILTEQGLSLIDSSHEFDPTRHEAIASEPHETVPSGHIIETLRAGYEYKGRVLRPALVRIAA
jgi:molecular chaperone GrpE